MQQLTGKAQGPALEPNRLKSHSTLAVVSVPLRNSSPLPRPRECACDRVGCHWGPLRSFISYKHSVGRKEASVPIRPVGAWQAEPRRL